MIIAQRAIDFYAAPDSQFANGTGVRKMMMKSVNRAAL